MSTNAPFHITPQVLLKAYACGIFPMAESADDPSLFWVEPEERGIIPLNRFHVGRSLSKFIRKNPFEIRINRDFNGVIGGCREKRADRNVTWINDQICGLYAELFEMGQCHTVEVYQQEQLVGGLYGVQLGSAFFGESMFSRVTNASKTALVYLVARLIEGRFTLLDTQFTTDHLKSFGAVDITRHRYHLLLETALPKKGDFFRLPEEVNGKTVLEIIQSQKSLV